MEDQKGQPGQATLTLVQFDTEDPYEIIHDFKAIAEIPPLTRKTFVPRGGTPLLDAMGRGINDLEKRIGDLQEADRPAKVVMAVVTDGQENASSEFDTKILSAWSRSAAKRTAGSSYSSARVWTPSMMPSARHR